MSFQNYTTIFEKDSADLHSRAYLLRHTKSGARVFILSNEDDNKVFYIGFRTTPSDDTGVAHIMEHSVLCGSEKYPLKDPFVELVKGSMNTFLNAMTYPDKTVYPVASTNDKDFRNLMSVYMDAVLRPNIYRHPEIMKQEGWNYSIHDASDPIEYNGVVYNEMKGAFSSPEAVLERETLHSMFPDTTYGYESGGDPQHIPELTYEKFLDFHRTYYHPSNSYIYLYGDMDVEERLSWLDREYLSGYEQITVDSEIGDQPSFTARKEIRKEYAVGEEEPIEQNTYLSYNIHCGSNLDPVKYYALQMIQYAMVDTQGAPIRQRLLDEGIGKDILCGFENGQKQQYFSIISKNAEEAQAEQFLAIINEEFRKAADGQLNHRSLLASLNSLEFKYKEADFGGYPKGLIYGLNALDSWLYDDLEPLMHIECSETFCFLREHLDTGYFEELIRTYLVDSGNSALIILLPRKGLSAEKDRITKERLQKYKDSLNEEEIQKLIKESESLAQYQEQEDPPELKNCIPLLTRQDISRKAPEFSNIEENVDGISVIRHDYYTNGIAYCSLFFDANSIPYEKLPYLSLLKSVISFVDTDHYTYSELNDEINIVAGGMTADTGIYTDRYDDSSYSLLTDLSFRTLYTNLPETMDLAKEVLFHAHYEDTKRLYEIIAELKSKLQMVLNSSGHVAASVRAASYYSESAAVREQMNGIAFYQFVEHLEQHFEEEKDNLVREIKEIVRNVFAPDHLLISFTGDTEGYELFRRQIGSLKQELEQYHTACGLIEEQKEPVPVKDRKYRGFNRELIVKNEGFRTSSAIQYVARGGRYSDKGADYTGSIKVFLTIMRFDYLWFHVRVQGGAYGCMCQASSDGSLNFVSYRDPNLRKTNDVYEGVPQYLEQFDAVEREMTKYIIGTMSGIDTPLTPSLKGTRDINAYLTGIKQEDVQKAREEIIDTTVENIRSIAPLVRKALDMNNICVVGSSEKISEDQDLFAAVADLF